VHDEFVAGPGGLLADLPPGAAEQVGRVLAASKEIELEPGEPALGDAFPKSALLVVDDGFVVVRASYPRLSRSIITCEAGAGRILLPPARDQVLVALVRSRVTAIPADLFDQLLSVPFVAQRVVEQMAFTVGQKQEAIGNFAQTRHVERVRRKLLQLARSYGHVVRDGIRIDFPVSHALLAEMIGSSRETVTRALDQLQRAGFVTRRGSVYQLLVTSESVFDAA
jgi:CRP-like cAMP-binding protein